MNTEIVSKKESKSVKTEKKHLVLFNDNDNTFDHVINLLVKVCKHDAIQAEQCAFLVHYKGKCTVKSGAIEELSIIAEILADNGLTVEIN
ncbi:MAG: ATP-dependent Clp protease adaptor ClpS [Flavobacteriales bacterium]|nr:ATP-dependent Clp protease adaptor ClpS [Flavobacteriales bacterium]MCB9363255.1 ATP-dependent Clp protease adaptor ClpS [Flavobacteriales bacterium]